MSDDNIKRIHSVSIEFYKSHSLRANITYADETTLTFGFRVEETKAKIVWNGSFVLNGSEIGRDYAGIEFNTKHKMLKYLKNNGYEFSLQAIKSCQNTEFDEIRRMDAIQNRSIKSNPEDVYELLEMAF